MVKLASVKGFTLIETLLVLSILSICILVFPVVKQNTSITFRYEIQEIQSKLINAQQTAIREKRDVFVDFLGNVIQIDHQPIKLSRQTACHASRLHFTPLGNVSNALNITCTQNKHKKQIVVQLGTGRMYVK